MLLIILCIIGNFGNKASKIIFYFIASGMADNFIRDNDALFQFIRPRGKLTFFPSIIAVELGV